MNEESQSESRKKDEISSDDLLRTKGEGIRLASVVMERDKAVYAMQRVLQKAEAKGIQTRIAKGSFALVTANSVHYRRAYIVQSDQYLLYYSGGIKMPEPHFEYPEFKEFENRIISEKSTLTPDYEKACEIAKKLSSQYDVSVAVLDQDKDFYADDSIRKSIQEDIYFISAESPEATLKVTEHLIRFQQHKFRLMIDAATTKRVEQSASNNVALSKSINEVRDELLASNPNKKPALSRIAEILNERGVVSPRGKESRWYAETVKRILERTPKDQNDSPKTGHQK